MRLYGYNRKIEVIFFDYFSKEFSINGLFTKRIININGYEYQS